MTAGIVGAGLLIAGLISALQMRRGERRDAFRRVVDTWHRLCASAGVPVRHGETPSVLASRLAKAEPAAGDSARLFARMVNSHYYSAGKDDEGVEQLKRMRRLLATMKRQLRRSGTRTGRSSD